MHELVINLHIHTCYSDGTGTHADIIQAAARAGLDAILITDHNLFVSGVEGYYQIEGRRVLLLVGEEIHDQTRLPQKNHLLIFGIPREMAIYAHDWQRVFDMVREGGGLAFIAHPHDPHAPAFGQPDISWVDWQVNGYHGIELWNAMSEFKSLLKSIPHGLFYAYNPQLVGRSPFAETLRKWDELLASGRSVIAIGGSDAHALHIRLGPLKRVIFPYEFHFHAVNTHLLIPTPLKGDVREDRQLILEALRQGHAFIGYDLPAPTNGFRFTASTKEGTAWMGDSVLLEDGVTFQIRLPRRAECHLLKDGQVIKIWRKREICTHIATESGVYRVEVYTHDWGRRRGWIFSNPIYVKEHL